MVESALPSLSSDKKGIRSVAANYRALSVGANLSKILPRIILSRISDAYEGSLGESQFGFRKGRSTADAIFVAKSFIDKLDGTMWRFLWI